jgi:phage terminase large subunit GpA-like protein
MSRHPALSRETLAAIKRAVRKGMDGMKAEPRQRLSDWAAAHFLMAGESSQQKGGWLAWVFQIGIMDFMSDDRIEDLYVIKSKRVGYTKMITAFLAYCIAHLRRNVALWQPTDDDRDSYVKSEIDPVLDPIKVVSELRKAGGKDHDTIKLKQFLHSVVHLLGGKAARAFRRITVAVAILDEWSKFDHRIEKTGDAKGLAKGRLEGSPFPKFIGGTTPLLKGLDQAETACELAEGMVRFHIECPHCQAEHPLIWGGKELAHGFKWESGKPETVRHVCPHCRGSITQADYLKLGAPSDGVWRTGAWVCEKTGKRYGVDRVWRDTAGQPCRPPRTLGLHTWSAYSPQRSWPSIVEELIHALVALSKGDIGPMQLFVNETLGQTWELAGERSDEHALQKRAEPYTLGTVPVGGLVLTAGIDVQRNRWHLNVYAWGRGLESWVVDRHVIDGNPAADEDWDQLTAYLQRRYTQAWHGGTLGLSAISIDSSDQTHAVYNWVRRVQHTLPTVRAVKGSSEDHKPILGPSSSQEVNWKGQKWPNGVKLWTVGVDTAKDLLLGQLGIEPPATPGESRPGCVHFSTDLPREFYEQLTAEQRILVKVGGRDAYKWVKRRPRNEDLDCRNYALHAAFGLGLHNRTDAKWAQLEAAVQPSADLFTPAAVGVAAPAPQVTAPTPKPQPPRPQPARNPAVPRRW